MNTVKTVRELRAAIAGARSKGKRIALVPTMGNLHSGHVALVEKAKQRADFVVTSIFVNPLQFGPSEDLSKYPRSLAADQEKLIEVDCDLLFAPELEEIYPDGMQGQTTVHVPVASEGLCGASRPGHFDGVATVVSKLFNMVQPDLAIFGEKDFQQLAVIRKLVRDLNMSIQIMGEPTVRAEDGLALSSRNQHLTPAQRGQAVCLRQALDEAERRFAAGERDPQALKDAMRARIAREPDARIDYVEIADDDTLTPLDGPITRPALAALAVRIGQPRLIDNTVLRP